MTSELARREEGQALVIVGLALFVLMGSLALSVDWGYSLLTRRGAQNEADAAALGAGRYLASSYVGGASPFEVSREAVWCEARRQRDLNSRSTPTSVARSLSLSFLSAAGTPLATPITTADCVPPGSTSVPPATAYLRVQSNTEYSSLFGAITRQPTIRVSGSARVRLTGSAGLDASGSAIPGVRALQPLPAGEIPGVGLSGSTTRPNVALWPLVRRYNASEFSGLPCGQYAQCDATRGRITLWPDARFGSFSGLVSYAHFSPREAPYGDTHQVITESDYTGHPVSHHSHPAMPLMPNGVPLDPTIPRACGGSPTWDPYGYADLWIGTPESLATSCDLPNWFRYGYRGSIGLGTNFGSASWTGFYGAPRAAEMPPALTNSRYSCGAQWYFPTPSCATNSTIGDWVETVPSDLTPLMADQMRSFIRTYGRLTPKGLGRAVVVHVFLWDCAEHFDSSQPVGSRWNLIVAPDADGDLNGCQLTPRPVRINSVDRVHLVSVVPLTVYENDVRTDNRTVPPTVTVYAYWGDVFGDAGACGVAAAPPATLPPGCSMNPLFNSAFLVPDE